MGFLGLNFNVKYKEMLKDLSGYINSSEFKNMTEEKKEELYDDYCLLKRLMKDKKSELKKLYYGSADSITTLWPHFMKSKSAVKEINTNASGTTTLEQYFLSDFTIQAQIKAKSLTKATEKMYVDLDEILEHPAVTKKYQKYCVSPTKNDATMFSLILNEQINRVKNTINQINDDIKCGNVIGMSQADCEELLREIQQNGNFDNIRNCLFSLMSKYRESISEDAISCKAFFDGIDSYYLTDYVINENGRQEMEKFIFKSSKHVSKL